MWRASTIFGAMVALLGAACGDDGTTPVMDSGTDSAMPDSSRPEIGTVDGSPDADASMGDGNDSFAEAVPITLGEMASGVIDPAGDVDYYSFTAMAGDWVFIATDANPDDDPMMVDTVITLYDSAMTQVAENDDSLPRNNTDSELIYHVPADGMYFIEVQEWSTWANDTPEGMASFTYDVSVGTINPMAPGLALDAETGNDAMSATAAALNMNFNLIIGTFADGMDVDVFSFSYAGATPMNLSTEIMPWGTDGYGSTVSAGNIWVTNMAGDTIIARIDNRTMGFNELSVPITAGTYLLWFEHPGTAAANDFYVNKTFLLTENDPETMDATNGTLAMAEPLTLEADMMGSRRAFVLANLGMGDVDYYSFDVMAMEQVTIACGAENSGSGVRGLSVELRDSADAVVAMASEMGGMNAFIEDQMVTPGMHYLRLTKTGQDPEVTGDFVRCGVFAAAP